MGDARGDDNLMVTLELRKNGNLVASLSASNAKADKTINDVLVSRGFDPAQMSDQARADEFMKITKHLILLASNGQSKRVTDTENEWGT